MSFMFNPHPYDDMSAINKLCLPEGVSEAVVSGSAATAGYLSTAAKNKLSNGSDFCIIAMEGYISAQWEQVIDLMARNISESGIEFVTYDISEYYKPAEELNKMFDHLLPQDRVKDPVLLFGRLTDGSYEDIFDKEKLGLFIDTLKREKDLKPARKKTAVVFGCGTACKSARPLYDYIAYFDVTSKQAILRAKNGSMKNLGDKEARPFKEMLRRAYYVDFELACELRGELLEQGLIDYYIASDKDESMRLIPSKEFDEIMKSLAERPFRCKPVYIEGIWGGQFTKKIRKLPDTIKNVAWVFDMIPLEVSILADTGKDIVEFPYFTFVQKEGKALMGEACVKKFNGYFAIRFNYDDTYHSSGNMSIQVHPTEEYCRNNYNEHGRQDESYYIVATGHGAKTYVGFKEGINADEFVGKVKASEKEHIKVDYDEYINSVPSYPGKQFLLPAGTIHASGRNQLILEIGSLTIGSYTYKMYDYLRADLDGVPRPIHTYHGERVLKKERTSEWVDKNLIQAPKLVRSGEGYAEYIVGEHDLIYFSLRRLEFLNEIEDDTNGQFHVLTLVDGEDVIIEALDSPERSDDQKLLDVVVVPANIGRYVVRNRGSQPVVIHKTMLKEGFYEE